MLNKFLKSTFAYLVLILLLSFPLFKSFYNPNLINAHDSMAGLIRALSMDRYMGHGQGLVRWSPDVNWGYGYPMFNFYPPFFSFISVLFFHLTHQMILAIDWACILFWGLSGIGMFLFAREYWGNEGGLLSAVLYVYAPYHIIDLYVRGAFAEFSSFAFFPFILLSILLMCRKGGGLGAFLLGVISVFGLSLTHNIMSMLFLPLAAVYMLYLYIFENRSAWIFKSAGIIAIGLMMSSFFWLPALVEKQYLTLSYLTFMRYDFHKNFITLGELFWPLNNFNVDNMSFKVGIIPTLLCVATLCRLPKIFKLNKQLGWGFIFFLVNGLLAVFLTLSNSLFLWEHIKLLSFIQFPWRILTVIVFSMSFLCGSAAILIQNPRIKVFSVAAVILLVITFSLKSNPQPTFINDVQRVEDFLALGEGEYTPKWVVIPPNGPPDRKFDVFSGEGRLAPEKMINPVHYVTKFLALQPSSLYFNSFYFPGWQVLIDGQPTDPHLDNPYGLILFNVPYGDHDIQVFFGTTPIRITGMIFSVIGLILLIGVLFWKEMYATSLPD